MVLPPSDDGAIHVMSAEPSPGEAETLVGLPGAVGATGATGLDGSDSGPSPTELVAWTVKVYSVPLVSPDTVQLVPPLTGHGRGPRPCSVSVTAYPVIERPPLSDGADQEISAEALPAVALTAVGAPGTAGAVTVSVAQVVPALTLLRESVARTQT